VPSIGWAAGATPHARCALPRSWLVTRTCAAASGEQQSASSSVLSSTASKLSTANRPGHGRRSHLCPALYTFYEDPLGKYTEGGAQMTLQPSSKPAEVGRVRGDVLHPRPARAVPRPHLLDAPITCTYSPYLALHLHVSIDWMDKSRGGGGGGGFTWRRCRYW
jgi:hypothetical protein